MHRACGARLTTAWWSRWRSPRSVDRIEEVGVAEDAGSMAADETVSLVAVVWTRNAPVLQRLVCAVVVEGDRVGIKIARCVSSWLTVRSSCHHPLDGFARMMTGLSATTAKLKIPLQYPSTHGYHQLIHQPFLNLTILSSPPESRHRAGQAWPGLPHHERGPCGPGARLPLRICHAGHTGGQ